MLVAVRFSQFVFHQAMVHLHFVVSESVKVNIVKMVAKSARETATVILKEIFARTISVLLAKVAMIAVVTLLLATDSELA